MERSVLGEVSLRDTSRGNRSINTVFLLSVIGVVSELKCVLVISWV